MVKVRREVGLNSERENYKEKFETHYQKIECFMRTRNVNSLGMRELEDI